MGDVDAGNVKAKASIEYDPSGLKQMKEDLQSLGEITGGLGESTGAAGDGLAALDEQMSKGAGTARSFTSAIGELPKMMESGTSVISDMTDALSEQQGVIEAIQEPLKSYNESMQAVSDTMSGPHLTENLSAFQDALENPYPFQMIGQYLSETGQNWGDFTSTIGENNTAMLHEMANNADVTHQVLGSMSSDVQSAGKTFTESASSAAAFTEQFNGVTEAIAQTNEGINRFGGAGSVLAGPLEELQSYKSVGFGEALGNASEGLMGALNDIAMPLMAVQMIGMAVQAVGQSIYDAAAVAEGPGAHSFGSFTGTVDALGQTVQRAGAQFSEGFGQGMLPALNELNYEANQSQGSMGPFGESLGLAASTLASLWQIGSGTDIGGGLEGLANVGAKVIGVSQPFQGPGPQQQAQIQYDQTVANMPQTVQGQVYQMKTQSATLLADSITPAYLQAQDDLSASQMIYQRVQASYNASHPVNQYDLLQQAQYQAYAQQQATNYQGQMQNPTYSPYDPMGFWGGVFGGMGQGFNNFFGNSGGQQSLYGGGTRPPSTPFDGFFNNIGGFFGGIGGGIGSFFGGLGQDWNNLFGQASPPPAMSSTSGCFPAGTRVLMADGSEKPIETLQVGEKVLACEDLVQVTTTILALIKPPPRWVYELTFSDGNTLTLTASHPIATPLQGWKSLSPIATKKENPDLPVTTLEVGDSVCTVYGTATLVSIQPREVVQVYNIEVDEPHTFYANRVLAHNKMGSMTNSGVGSEDVSISHTFTATVNWAATGLEKQFTAAANWIGQGLTNTFQGVANWVAQGLANTFTGVANWIGQGLENLFTGQASWIGQDLENLFTGVASWTGQNLIQPFTAMATWIGQGLENLFTGKAHWIGQDLEHMFTAVAQWTAQNLNPSFTVNPSVTMLAEGASNFAGGPAIVGEAGTEVVEHNGQYSLFDQGAALVNLPAGANVYPMKNVAQFADGTGDGPVIPITFGSSGRGASMPESVNIFLQVDGQTFWSATGISLAQSARAGSGIRSY